MQYVADNIVKAIRMYNEIHCFERVYEESQPFVLGSRRAARRWVSTGNW